jgi:hypothetical protein
MRGYLTTDDEAANRSNRVSLDKGHTRKKKRKKKKRKRGIDRNERRGGNKMETDDDEHATGPFFLLPSSFWPF